MTKMQLANMMFISGTHDSVIIDSDGCSHIGVVCSVLREDGSGNKFIVTIRTSYKGMIAVFVRTID